MIKTIHCSAFALLLMMPFAVNGQNESAGSDELAGPAEQTVPVAVDETPPESAAADASEEELLREFARYRRLVLQGTLDEADIAAKKIVEMAIRVYGPQSRETASALNNLGIVQHSSGQYDAAIQNFTSAIEIIEIVEDRLNDALVNPLKGLGAAQLGNGRPDQAQQTFSRAAHITHVNEGPHNLDQIEILESLAETYIRLDDTKEARNTLDRIQIINVKHFEKDPMGLLPSLMNRAAWQHRAGYYAEERASYRRAIRIVETATGKDDPMLIEPLRRLGESYYYLDVAMTSPQQQGLVSSGEMYFKRAVNIAEDNPADGWLELVVSKVALADYYTYSEAQNRARRIYSEVWEMLSTDEQRLAIREEWFADPVAIRTDTLPTAVGGLVGGRGTRNDAIAGQIVVDYSVSSRGRVKDLKTEAFPPEFTDLQSLVHRELRRRIFRPRLENGVAVDAGNLRFEHPFSYLQADLDSLRAKNEGESEADEEQQAAPAETEDP